MKIVIVTGGSRGLGKNMSQHLSRLGYGVILTYKSQKEEAFSVVESIEQEGGSAVALPLDVSSTKGFEAFKNDVSKVLQDKWQVNRFDALVNNAGIGINKPFLETTEDEFDTLVNIHFKAPVFLSQALLPLMNDGGKILNVSSGLARFCLPGYSIYGALKGAVDVLSRYMAKELGERKITVNTIAPGAIETDFGGGVVRDNPAVNQFISSQTALGRVGLPDDIGGAVALLLSDESSWITGQRVEVSGGMLL